MRVDREREQVAAGQADEQQRALFGRALLGKPERRSERQAGDALAAHGDQRGIAHLREFDVACAAADDFFDVAARQREQFAARAHGERGNDAERERQVEQDAGAFARFARKLDRPADALDVGAHHVHADPASRHLRYRRGGRQSGFEDQPQPLLAVEQVGFGGGDDPGLDGAGDQAVAADAPPVVADRDHHPVAALSGGDVEEPDFALARGAAVGGGSRCRGRSRCA